MKEIKSVEDMFTWLNDLARWVFDKQLTSIQVCDSHLEATQSLNQADTLHHIKVIAITAEILI